MEDNNAPVPLDDHAIKMIAEFDEQSRAIELARQVVINYFVRTNHLEDRRWDLAESRRELVLSRQQPQPQPAPQQQRVNGPVASDQPN